MAKQKTKRSMMDTTATEVRPGVWQFKAGEHIWEWDSTHVRLNLSCARADDPGMEWTDMLFARNLDNAVMYAWGFNAGLSAGRAETQNK